MSAAGETASTVLVVDSDPGTAEALRGPVRESGLAGGVDAVATLAEGLEALAGHDYAILVLSLAAAEAEGLAGLVRVRTAHPALPVVTTTDVDDRKLAVAALQHGAQDCALKEDLRGRGAVRILRHAIERQRILLELEEARHREQYLATHDPLTGVPNRTLFYDRLAQAIASARRYGKTLAILFLDLDGFKQVNDAQGHEAGDRVLREMAHRIGSIVRESDTVARIGGDEFTVILTQVAKPEDAGTVARNMLAKIAAPVRIGDETYRIRASIGISVFPRDGEESDALVRNADAAMYRAKAQGGGRYVFYEPDPSRG